MNIDENMLQFLLKEANINNIDEVSDKIEEMKNQEYLNMHPYKITTNKDGRFSTYLPDNTKPNNRRKIVKPTLELLKKEIIKYYKECEKQKVENNLSLKDWYPIWLDFKSLHTTSSAYIKTIDELWKRYYLNDPISSIPLKELDAYVLDNWIHSIIKKNSLTKKQYYNMAIIVRQSLDLAVMRGIIDTNPLANIKVDKKLFKPVKKKSDETQVYLLDEQPLIEKEAYSDFEKTGNSASLAIPFAFQTGLRISEIVALKWSDINEEKENCIHIQRMETKLFERLADGSWSSENYTIIERTKSDAGNRNVYLTTAARDILQKVKTANISNNSEDTEFIFLNNRKRVTARSLNTILRRCCKAANIPEKGMHKIRKTYISTLIDSENININYIREQVGHSDERTTFGNYCFNRKTKDQTAAEMEKALVHDL